MESAHLGLQLVNGLVDAVSMFLVASGLSLIFGVTRIVNFAHGSLYLVGLYVAVVLERQFGGGIGVFAVSCAAGALAAAATGAVLEVGVLRRLYRAPALFQLLATFAVVLILHDGLLLCFGPDDLLAPRLAHLSTAVVLLGGRMARYDLLLLLLGPAFLALFWLVLKRTRAGLLVRAASQDRDMLAALGVDQKRLFTLTFVVGTALAGLAGALAAPRTPATLDAGLDILETAFVVVVLGGLGSLPGAFAAAVLVGEARALCFAFGTVHLGALALPLPRLTLAVEFVVMAVVLALRPQGLLGQRAPRTGARVLTEVAPEDFGARAKTATGVVVATLCLLPWLGAGHPYWLVLGSEILIAALYAASLYLLLAPAGIESFGHAAYFGLGAYGAALAYTSLHWPFALALVCGPLLGLLGAALFGLLVVRLSGIYSAMLTLAFAQIVWSVAFQWDSVTGGSNGVLGVWPPHPWDGVTWSYGGVLAVTLAALLLLYRAVGAPFGHALRAARDAELGAAAIGIPVQRVRWQAFVVAGGAAGLAGALYAFSKGSIDPEVLGVGRSVDGLIMVLLGGLSSLAGPWVGAAGLTLLEDSLARTTDYWHAALGVILLALVLAFPDGLARLAGRRPRTETQR